MTVGKACEETLQIHVRKALAGRCGQDLLIGEGEPVQAYICGLNEMVTANRAQFKELGWDRKQIIFERYD